MASVGSVSACDRTDCTVVKADSAQSGTISGFALLMPLGISRRWDEEPFLMPCTAVPGSPPRGLPQPCRVSALHGAAWAPPVRAGRSAHHPDRSVPHEILPQNQRVLGAELHPARPPQVSPQLSGKGKCLFALLLAQHTFCGTFLPRKLPPCLAQPNKLLLCLDSLMTESYANKVEQRC